MEGEGIHIMVPQRHMFVDVCVYAHVRSRLGTQTFFRHVFDCRFFLPVFSTAAFLERVGLAPPKSPPVGLLRPVVIDAQWHIRLREYMQQAVMRGSVDTLAASHQEVLMLEVTTAHYNAIISRRQG